MNKYEIWYLIIKQYYKLNIYTTWCPGTTLWFNTNKLVPLCSAALAPWLPPSLCCWNSYCPCTTSSFNPTPQYSTSPKWSQFSGNSLLKHGFKGGETNISRKGLTCSTCNYVIIPLKNHKVDHVSSASAGIYIETSPFYTINTRLWTWFLPTRIWAKFQRQTLGVHK